MRALTEAERQYLTETQSLTLDETGRDVLVGLTYQESSLLMAYRRQFTSGNRDRHPDDLTNWLELAQKHDLARTLCLSDVSSPTDSWSHGRRPELPFARPAAVRAPRLAADEAIVAAPFGD